MSLKSMENTFLSCPDMLGISELVLTPFMERPVKSTFLSVSCVPGYCDPKLKAVRLPLVKIYK